MFSIFFQDISPIFKTFNILKNIKRDDCKPYHPVKKKSFIQRAFNTFNLDDEAPLDRGVGVVLLEDADILTA